jgi:hypothetical protein
MLKSVFAALCGIALVCSLAGATVVAEPLVTSDLMEPAALAPTAPAVLPDPAVDPAGYGGVLLDLGKAGLWWVVASCLVWGLVGFMRSPKFPLEKLKLAWFRTDFGGWSLAILHGSLTITCLAAIAGKPWKEAAMLGVAAGVTAIAGKNGMVKAKENAEVKRSAKLALMNGVK